MAWAPNYVTLQELGSFMRILDSLDDDVMGPAIAAASRAIDLETGRQFGVVNIVEYRYYTPYWHPRLLKWTIDTDDIASATDFEVASDSAGDYTYVTDIPDYRLIPLNALQKGRPWEGVVLSSSSSLSPSSFAINSDVRVQALFGWLAVPEAIKNATLIQASRLVTRRDAPFGVTGSAETGGELRLLSKLDADVKVTVQPYIRWWGSV